MQRSTLFAIAAVAGSATLYIVACALPALDLRPLPATGSPTPPSQLMPQTWPGFALLLMGWAGIFSLEFAWFANPLLFLAWLAVGFRRWRVALMLATLALLCAADLLLGRPINVIGDTDTRQVIVDRAHIGTFVWVAAIADVIVGATIGWITTRRGAVAPAYGAPSGGHRHGSAA